MNVGKPVFSQLMDWIHPQEFERGFIVAETVAFDDLIHADSFAKVRELGKLRIEGKEYLVKDGDVMEFRFNL